MITCVNLKVTNTIYYTIYCIQYTVFNIVYSMYTFLVQNYFILITCHNKILCLSEFTGKIWSDIFQTKPKNTSYQILPVNSRI